VYTASALTMLRLVWVERKVRCHTVDFRGSADDFSRILQFFGGVRFCSDSLGRIEYRTFIHADLYASALRRL
jgi:hypothetical protein